MNEIPTPTAALRMLRLPDVVKKTGLSGPVIYRSIHRDGFPRGVRLGLRAVAWVEAEIDAWLLERMANRSGVHGEKCVGPGREGAAP